MASARRRQQLESPKPTRAEFAARWHRQDNLWSAEVIDWLRQVDPEWYDLCCHSMNQEVLASAGDISGFLHSYIIWHSEPEPEFNVASSYTLDAGLEVVALRLRWIQDHTQSWLGLWRVLGVFVGEGMVLTDLLTGQERCVHERGAARPEAVGQVLLARVVTLDHDLHVLAGGYPQVLPVAEALKVRQIFFAHLFPRRRKLKPEELRTQRAVRALSRFWILHLACLYPDEPRVTLDL